MSDTTIIPAEQTDATAVLEVPNPDPVPTPEAAAPIDTAIDADLLASGQPAEAVQVGGPVPAAPEVEMVPVKRGLEAIKADIEAQFVSLSVFVEQRADLARKSSELDAAESAAKSVLEGFKAEFESAVAEFRSLF